MANYCPMWRTNYFQVKDEAAFRAWVSSFIDAPTIEKNPGGPKVGDWFMLHSYHTESGTPGYREPSREEVLAHLEEHDPEMLEGLDGDELEGELELSAEAQAYDNDVDFYAELATHLTDDCVAVGMEIGNEKIRYLTGVVCVVDSSGRTDWVDLNEWAMKTAQTMFPGKTCTLVEY